jgi:hypothetical protein
MGQRGRFNQRLKKMSNNGSRLIRPDSVSVETSYLPGPQAQPSAVTLQQPGQIKMLVVGGLSKLETVAMHLAAASVVHSGKFDSDTAIAGAELLLSECAKIGQQETPNVDDDAATP